MKRVRYVMRMMTLPIYITGILLMLSGGLIYTFVEVLAGCGYIDWLATVLLSPSVLAFTAATTLDRLAGLNPLPFGIAIA